MDLNNSHNQSYWFVLREDQSNVIFSSNNFNIQNPPRVSQETRYIVDTGDSRQYIQINEDQGTEHAIADNNYNKDLTKQTREENFWDRNKIRLLLTLCLDDRFKNVSKDKTLWNEISPLIGAEADECNKKYRNLRRTYMRLLKKKQLGKDIKWVHYSICEEVFKECKALPLSELEPWEDNKVKKLLSLYIENLNKFRNPECLQKDVWKEIAATLGTTEYDCYHKFKNLKRTYFNWLEKSRETGKLIKWPYHNYFEKIFYNYNPNLGPWDRTKIKQLIEAYAQTAHKFRNPKFQKKELWKDISTIVGESPSNCDRKFRNLKQTYIRIKMKSESGITKWRYYKDFEGIYNNPNYSHSKEGMPELICKYQEEDYVKQLLTYYIDNMEKFRDPLLRKHNVWRTIGRKLGLTSEECDRKFRNLKQTYVRLRHKQIDTGKCHKWPYYAYFEKIYDEPCSRMKECSHNGNDDIPYSEIKRVMQTMQDRHDKDKFNTLIKVIQDSNNIQRERNKILQALLDRK
ncbi:uncharacterized protein LOC131855683 [Achroia grisella]|uniref:uncharacterized protein LOC131855683 n=1 Tax=Achroia grisella TaxID=688607 RepID=UPI0027D2CEEC|nr:uncharacterized protein LOC131855683 [Achroia grisella]